MKRFVVIVTSLLIIFVFIALNYLIWDRESLVDMRDSNQASIDALSRINMSLNQEKARLEQQVEALREKIQGQDEKILSLEKDIQQYQRDVEEKSQFILKVKEKLNTEPVRVEALNWATNLSEKNFEKAFQKGGSYCRFWGNLWSLRLFSEFFEQNIESIKIIREGEKEQALIQVIPSQTANWDIQVRVHIHVTLKENSQQDYLKPDENVLLLNYTYSERSEQWLITSVSTETMQDNTTPEASENGGQ